MKILIRYCLCAGKGVDAILNANYVVNATGLYAQSFARNLDGLPESSIPPSHFARGCYFSLSGVKSPFSHLIYPIPEDGGLGCHVTLDLGGQIRFGPDVEWLPELMNSVSLASRRVPYLFKSFVLTIFTCMTWRHCIGGILCKEVCQECELN